MRIARYSGSGSFAFVAAIALAGCSGPFAGPRTLPDNPTSRLAVPLLKEKANAGLVDEDAPSYKVSGPLLYATNVNAHYSSVTIYDPKTVVASPVGVITAGLSEPVGDCIDDDGTLYVTNEPGSGLGWISEYALGQTKPVRLITQGINIPGFCAVDRHGNLWVTNIGGPNVTEYLKGSTAPHFVLSNGLTYPNSVAIDNAGRIYVGNLNIGNPSPSNPSNVQVFEHGGKSPSRTITNGITWPGGIALNASDTLYVSNGIAPCNIELYLKGQSTPYLTITNEINGPPAVVVAPSGWMYEVNAGTQGCNGPAPAILEFPPRATKPSKHIITNSLHDPEGVAYYAPARRR